MPGRKITIYRIANIGESKEDYMIQDYFWWFLAACAITGIGLMIRGFVIYKKPFKSKMWFFIGGLLLLAPAAMILVYVIWYFEIIDMPFFSILIIFFEVLLLLVFFASLFGRKTSRISRNITLGYSIFSLVQLITLSLVVGLITLFAGPSLMNAFQWSDGFRYEEKSGEITIKQYKGNETNVVIPSFIDGKPVTEIAGYTFKMNRKVTSITIPGGVTVIGCNTFEKCTSLTSVTIPEGLTGIGDNAFAECTSLTSVTIPDSVTSIGFGAFTCCTSLTSVTIPDSVKTLDSNPFMSCSSLTGIYVSPSNSSFVSVGGILYSKNMEEIIACPGGKAGTIQIPDTVKDVGDYAFRDCSKLTVIILPDNTNRIGGCSFADCSSLQEITIPDSVTSIGYCAFANCELLTSVTIPASVTSIDRNAFSNCMNLAEIIVSPKNSLYKSDSGILFNRKKAEVICCPPAISGEVTLPDGVITIGDQAFNGCSKITSITLSDGTENIGIAAFDNCENLENITIPDSVTNIDFSALDSYMKVVVYCKEGSYAQSFAEKHKIKYELIE